MDIWSETLEFTTGKNRRLMLKMIAERSLFRSLILLSTVVLFYRLCFGGLFGIELAFHIALPLLLIVPFCFFHWIAYYNLERIKINSQNQ